MLKLDALSQLKQLKSEIKASRNLVCGTVKGSAHKFGFVTLDSGRDIYLPPDEMQKILPGDRIEVEVKKDAKNKNVAQIERLLKSPTKTFYGKYVSKGNAHFVDPDISGMTRWIFIPPAKRGGAKTKDLVKCRITQHPIRTGKAQASIIEVLGCEQDKGIEWKYAISKHDIQTDWNEHVEAQLKKLDQSLIELKKEGREDLTDLPFVTIDAPSTVDMDDALWADKREDGWELYVAIADPVAMIESDSPIEKECLRRATSMYFPGLHVPMLPEKLAADLCSLVEGKERLAKVLKIRIKADGVLGDYHIVDAVIRSRQSLSYTDASEFLNSGKEVVNDLQIHNELPPVLNTLKSLSDALIASRAENSLVHADRKEFFLELNDKQKIKAIREKEQTVAHRIVEESMVAANRCIADLLAKTEVPSLFIGHKGVREDRLEALAKVIGEQIPECAEEDLSCLSGFVKSVKAASASDALKPIHSLIFRQLEKSAHATTPKPHFGMGLEQYTTFTSPLRKANDYLIHRQLSSILSGEDPVAITTEQLEALASSWQRAKEAVFNVEQWLKCQYMAQKKDAFEGMIVRTFSSGFQVRLDSNGIEGFVSTKEMEGKFSFSQELLTLTGKSQRFVLDQKIMVRLKQVDWSRKQLQFVVSEPSNLLADE